MTWVKANNDNKSNKTKIIQKAGPTLFCSFQAAAAVLCSTSAGTTQHHVHLQFSLDAQPPTAARQFDLAVAWPTCRSHHLHQSDNSSRNIHSVTVMREKRREEQRRATAAVKTFHSATSSVFWLRWNRHPTCKSNPQYSSLCLNWNNSNTKIKVFIVDDLQYKTTTDKKA